MQRLRRAAGLQKDFSSDGGSRQLTAWFDETERMLDYSRRPMPPGSSSIASLSSFLLYISPPLTPSSLPQLLPIALYSFLIHRVPSRPVHGLRLWSLRPPPPLSLPQTPEGLPLVGQPLHPDSE